MDEKGSQDRVQVRLTLASESLKYMCLYDTVGVRFSMSRTQPRNPNDPVILKAVPERVLPPSTDLCRISMKQLRHTNSLQQREIFDICFMVTKE